MVDKQVDADIKKIKILKINRRYEMRRFLLYSVFAKTDVFML